MRVFAIGWLVLVGAMPHAPAQTASPVLPGRQVQPPASPAQSSVEQSTRAVSRKVTGLVLPNVEFRQTTLNDAVEYLRRTSRQIDHDGTMPDRGVNIILQGPAAGGGTAGAPGQTPLTRITLSLHNVPLSVVLQYVANQAGLQMKIEPYAVILAPISEGTQAIKTATFRVPPTFFGNRPSGSPREQNRLPGSGQ